MTTREDIENNMVEGSKKLKVLDITQGVLWLKGYGIRSDALKEIREKDESISEGFLNQMMQLAYNEGAKDIDSRSFDVGWYACRKDMLKKLGVEEDY